MAVSANSQVPMLVGTCKLCQEEKELMRSHYMPAGLNRLRANKGSPQLVITQKYQVRTTEQMTDHILCGDCERRLNDSGEKWTLARLSRSDGFPLREALLKCPFRGSPTAGFFKTRGAKDIRHEKLAYFALSIFWRGAVKVWNRVGDETDRIDIGADEEQIRLYLLGRTGFPRNLVLVASVWPFDQMLTAVYHPRHAPIPPVGDIYKKLFFYVPGISFELFVG